MTRAFHICPKCGFPHRKLRCPKCRTPILEREKNLEKKRLGREKQKR